MLKINLTKDAAKFLSRVPAKHGKQIAKKLVQLQNNPLPNDSKKMIGYPFLRTDIGEYRIVYEFDDLSLRVLLIGKRNDDEVYKNLKRK